MADPLLECIANFGPPPRRISWWDRLTYLRLPKPRWLHSNSKDELATIFLYAPAVFREGVVVWGHVIQANQLMFRNGTQNCPGEVVYSLADTARAKPQYLKAVAQKLYALKGTEPGATGLFTIAAYLTNERVRVYGLPVPPSVSPIRCQISTTFFTRKHLPSRRLCSSLLPLVVNPTPPFVALPLPERYWPPAFASAWAS